MRLLYNLLQLTTVTTCAQTQYEFWLLNACNSVHFLGATLCYAFLFLFLHHPQGQFCTK